MTTDNVATKRESPYTDCNGTKIYEGDIVKGVGKHVGRSEVFFDADVWQPFSYLNDYDGSNFEVVKTAETPQNSNPNTLS